MATEVNLRVFGYQDNNSMITLCPRDKFMLVAECTVIESRTLVWLLRPLLSSTVGVNFFSDLGESRQEGVTFVLAKKSLTQIANENFYISQVQLHTDHIRDSIGPKEKLFIRCEADSSTDYALITLTLAGICILGLAMHYSYIIFSIINLGLWLTGCILLHHYLLHILCIEYTG